MVADITLFGRESTVEEVAKPFLPPAEFYRILPTIIVSACVLFTDTIDRPLLVKPSYKPYWQMPGGYLDDNEAPHEAAEREVEEEIGLKVKVGALLVVDFAPPLGVRTKPLINLMFDGGVIADPELIRLESDELEGFAFVTWDTAAALLPAGSADRIPAARRARSTGQTRYLSVQP